MLKWLKNAWPWKLKQINEAYNKLKSYEPKSVNLSYQTSPTKIGQPATSDFATNRRGRYELIA